MPQPPVHPIEEIIFSKPPEEVLEMLINELKRMAGRIDVKLLMMERQIKAGKPEKALHQIEGLQRIVLALANSLDSAHRYVERRKNDRLEG